MIQNNCKNINFFIFLSKQASQEELFAEVRLPTGLRLIPSTQRCSWDIYYTPVVVPYVQCSDYKHFSSSHTNLFIQSRCVTNHISENDCIWDKLMLINNRACFHPEECSVRCTHICAVFKISLYQTTGCALQYKCSVCSTKCTHIYSRILCAQNSIVFYSENHVIYSIHWSKQYAVQQYFIYNTNTDFMFVLRVI